MTVEDKIIFAEYFLKKIRDAKNREDFLPNLSAFLSETYSIPEYLLEDANVKFGLCIPLEDRILKEFSGKAAGNKETQSFFSTYKGKYKKLSQDLLEICFLTKDVFQYTEEDKRYKGTSLVN